MADSTQLKLKVTEALPKDLGRGLARLDPADMLRLGLEVGDIVELAGKRTTVGKAMPAYKEHTAAGADSDRRSHPGKRRIRDRPAHRGAQGHRATGRARGSRAARLSFRPTATWSTSAASSTDFPCWPKTGFGPPSSATARPTSRLSAQPPPARASSSREPSWKSPGPRPAAARSSRRKPRRHGRSRTRTSAG